MPGIRLIWPLLLMVSATAASAAMLSDKSVGRPAGCLRVLKALSGAEMERVVTGKTMSFAGTRGMCSRSWLTSLWTIDFRPDGTATRRFEFVVHADGRYFIRPGAGGHDQLCIASITSMASWNAPGPPKPYYSARTDCFWLFSDTSGRLYLSGGDLSLPEPAMIVLRPLS